MQTHTFYVDLDRGLRRFVQQQLGSPIEIVLLARIHVRRAFVFANGGERVVQFFIEVTEQVMTFGVVAVR